MDKRLRIAALVILAAVAGLLLASRPSDDAEPHEITPRAPRVTATAYDIVAVERPQVLARAEGGTGRNLFAYVAPPPREIVAPREVVATPIAVAAPPVVVEAPRASAPEPPRFPYRYIGRFGKDANPLAAFVRDGEIVTAHRGDRIGEGFTLRAIGIESVEVESRGNVVRIALGR